MKIQTTAGLIDRERLIVSDEITNEENARVTATVWRLDSMDGNVVRRDVWVNAYRGLEMTGKAA